MFFQSGKDDSVIIHAQSGVTCVSYAQVWRDGWSAQIQIWARKFKLTRLPLSERRLRELAGLTDVLFLSHSLCAVFS